MGKNQTPFLLAVNRVVRIFGNPQEFVERDYYKLHIDHPTFLDLLIESWQENGQRLISVANVLPQKGKIIEIVVDAFGSPVRFTAGGSQAIVHEFNDKGEIKFVDTKAKEEALTFIKAWTPIIDNYTKKLMDPKPYKVYEGRGLESNETFRFVISTVRYPSFIEEVRIGKIAIDLNSISLIHETADRKVALEMAGHVEF